MARFVAVHTLPYTEEQRMSQLSDMLGRIPAGFTWKQTYCDFDNHKFFCEWDTPSKEALAEGFKGVDMPFEAIYAVKLLDVASGKMT